MTSDETSQTNSLFLFLLGIAILGLFGAYFFAIPIPNNVPTTPPKNATMPLILKPTAELLLVGKKHFKNQCASCHGKEGRGDGPTSQSLRIEAQNFQTLTFQGDASSENFRSIKDIYETITTGRTGKMMPAFKYLPELDRWGLAYYVKELAEKNLASDATDDAAPNQQNGIKKQ